MNPKEMIENLCAVRQELDRMTFTGVPAARSIVGMAKALDQCIVELKKEAEDKRKKQEEKTDGKG